MVSMEMELSCRGLGILVIATLELAVQWTNPSGYCQGTCRRSARRGRAPVTMHKIHFQRAQASQVKRLFVSRSFASVAIVVSLVLVEECIQAGAGPPCRRRDKAGIVGSDGQTLLPSGSLHRLYVSVWGGAVVCR